MGRWAGEEMGRRADGQMGRWKEEHDACAVGKYLQNNDKCEILCNMAATGSDHASGCTNAKEAFRMKEVKVANKVDARTTTNNPGGRWR